MTTRNVKNPTDSFVTRSPFALVLLLAATLFSAAGFLALNLYLPDGWANAHYRMAVASVLINVVCMGICVVASGLALTFTFVRLPRLASYLAMVVPVVCVVQLFFILSGAYQILDISEVMNFQPIFAIAAGFLAGMAVYLLRVQIMSRRMADVLLGKFDDATLPSGDRILPTDRREIDDAVFSNWQEIRSRRSQAVARRRETHDHIRLTGYPR